MIEHCNTCGEIDASKTFEHGSNTFIEGAKASCPVHNEDWLRDTWGAGFSWFVKRHSEKGLV